MSQSLEDLVRAAQHEQAERAVDPQRILAALPQRRVQAVRRRRLVLAALATAVVAVVAVPVFALRQGPAPQPPSVTPSPAPSPSVSVADARFVPLRFSPHWLPAGYAEYFRTDRPPAGTNRIWSSAPPKSPLLTADLTGRLRMDISATEDAGLTAEPGDEIVDINGTSGVYRADGLPGLSWQLGGSTITLTADEPVLSRDTMLRVARSVRPDPAATELPFAVRVPAGQAIAAQTVAGVSAGNWFATVDLGEEAGGDIVASGTSVSIGTVTQAPAGGAVLKVAGHPARYLYSEVPEAGHYLVVDLGGGLKLTVYSLDLEQPAIVALAEAAGPPNPAAVGWLGS